MASAPDKKKERKRERERGGDRDLVCMCLREVVYKSASKSAASKDKLAKLSVLVFKSRE